jgi:uncharacterized protein YdhG (YjbR/CyaY superfamily)
MSHVSAREIDEYLERLDPEQRDALQHLREMILEAVPEGEEGLAYGVPAVRLGDDVVAGFAAAKTHLSYFPHSGWVLSQLAEEVADYSTSKGTLRFGPDRPLPMSLVRKLVAERRFEMANGRT